MRCRRIAITGLGLVSPHGTQPDAVFRQLVDGVSAVRLVNRETEAGSFQIVGAAVKEEPWSALPKGTIATSDRCGLFAIAAADSAIADAGLDLSAEDLDRVGVSVGTSLGGALSQEAAYSQLFRRPQSRLSPFTLVRVMYNGPAAQISLRYGLGGPNLTHTNTCSSSTVSIGEAARKIRCGDADVMIAGGTEALFAYVSIQAWSALQVLAPPRESDPEKTCRPFSKDRNGTVLGEGAAFLVLEELERAIGRGARIYGEVTGYAVLNDPGHMTQPSTGAQSRTMEAALGDAGLDPGDIDYINAHGTATRLNDSAETEAIKRVFGPASRHLAVSSTKSMHGHLVGAAGALEALIATLSLWHQTLPPTAHLDVPDPDLDLDFVANTGRKARVRAALTNSFAVGGTAATLVLTRLAS